MITAFVGRRVRRCVRLSPVLWSLAVALAAVPQPASAEPAGLRAFLDRVIVFETRPAASPAKDMKEFMTPRLATAIRKYDESDEIGLDYEPICQCQDAEGMKMRVRSIRGNDSTAVAELENRFTGKTELVSLHLTHGARGWRIADISTKGDPSLLRDLEK